jgi:hypothetical protein
MICSACGKDTKGGNSIGGILLCRTCAPIVRERIDSRRASGQQVNAAGIARDIYRETTNAGDYLLRDVPRELWDRAKHRAIDEQLSLRELVMTALEKYLA